PNCPKPDSCRPSARAAALRRFRIVTNPQQIKKSGVWLPAQRASTIRPLMARTPTEDTFYPDTLRHLMSQGLLSPAMKVLVACAGAYDRDVLHDLGFRDVTISNLDVRLKGTEFEPFGWSYQDVEHLTFGDG